MQGGTAKTGEQKNDRYHQQAVDLAFAEFRIGGHSAALPLNESYPGQVVVEAEAQLQEFPFEVLWEAADRARRR